MAMLEAGLATGETRLREEKFLVSRRVALRGDWLAGSRGIGKVSSK